RAQRAADGRQDAADLGDGARPAGASPPRGRRLRRLRRIRPRLARLGGDAARVMPPLLSLGDDTMKTTLLALAALSTVPLSAQCSSGPSTATPPPIPRWNPTDIVAPRPAGPATPGPATPSTPGPSSPS